MNKLSKRLLAMALSLTMVAGLVPAAFAAGDPAIEVTSYADGNVTFTLTGDKATDTTYSVKVGDKDAVEITDTTAAVAVDKAGTYSAQLTATASGTTSNVGDAVSFAIVDVAFDLNYETEDKAPDGGLYLAEAEVTAPAEPTRKGYVFVGWGKTAGATEAVAQLKAGTDATKATTFYAIWKEIPSWEITFDAKAPAQVKFGATGAAVTATAKEVDGQTATITYSSSDEKIFTVGKNDGVITPVKVGKAKVIATAAAADGKVAETTAEFAVEITKADRTLTVKAAEGDHYVGDEIVVTPTDNATADKPVYTAKSSKTDVATVTVDAETGAITVTAVKAGTATITVSSAATDNYVAAKDATVDVEVKDIATPTISVKVKDAKDELTALTATVGDANIELAATASYDKEGTATSIASVTLESSDPAVVAINAADGKTVEIKGAGKATITASVVKDSTEPPAYGAAKVEIPVTVNALAIALDTTGVSVSAKTYEKGNKTAEITGMDFKPADEESKATVTLTASDYTVTAEFETDAAGSDKKVTGTVKLKDTVKNYTLADGSFETKGTISRATATAADTITVKKTEDYVRTMDLNKVAGLPEGETFTYEVSSSSYAGLKTAVVEGSTLKLTANASGSADETVTVTATSTNYTVTITVTVKFTDKTPVDISGVTVANKTYDGKAIAYTGTVKVTDDTGADVTAAASADTTVEWYKASAKESEAPKAAGDYTLKITVAGDTYAGEKEYAVTIEKATITITADNKSAKVGDEEPTELTYKVTGLAEGEELATEPNLAIQNADMNTAGTYAIKASGAAAPVGGNYNDIVYVDGKLTVSKKSSGSSWLGGTTSTTTDSTTGAVTETTTKPDGTKVSTTTEKDGTVTVAETYTDGTTVTTTTKEGAITSEVKVPASVDKVTVTIPTAEAAKPGMVAVLVKADGTEEIVKTSIPGETGVKLTLTEDAKLKLIDNSKDFADLAEDHWATASVDFVTAREIFNGTGDGNFSPAANATRASLMTVLARLNGVDTEGGATWFEKGMAWAVEKGVSDGSEPDANITREQLVTMLYRYVGEPETTTNLSAFNDAESVSEWANAAMTWAVSKGIITGKEGSVLDPTGLATRAEVATILERYVKLTANA